MSNLNEAAPLPTPEDANLIHRDEPWTEAAPQSDDPNKPTWGVGGALLVWFLSILLVVFMPLVFLIPYAGFKGISIGNPNYLPTLVEFATNNKTAVLLQILALLPTHLLTFLLVWALVTRFGRESFWSAIGWGWSRGFRLWSCIGLGVLLFFVASLLAKLIGAEKPTQLEQLINSSLAARYAISFLAVFTAPFAEEFIYRGVLYAPLQRLAGVPGAVVIVLALFTIIHVPQYWPNIGVIAAVALLSIVLTVVRAYSGRLLPCIVIHLVFNGIQAALLIMEPYIHRFFPTPEQVAPTAAFLLPFFNVHF